MAKRSKPEQDIASKVEEVLARRRGPREVSTPVVEKESKFVVEYRDADKRVTSRWTYDLKKFKNGPILTEELYPDSEKPKKKNRS
jgi:hypothetical protein